MNKIVTITLIVLVAIAGIWFFTRGEQAAPATANPEPAAAESDVVIDVKGIDFAFDTTEITVNEGDVVTINFESTEGFHDWVVDEFRAGSRQVRPGTPTSVTFTADKAGTYEYYCSVGHHRAAGMVGTLTVVEAQ